MSQWPIKVSSTRDIHCSVTILENGVIKQKEQAQHFFDYEVRPEVGEAGSYFYHSHVGFQAVSVAGALIVEEQLDHEVPYSYDDERIVFLSELYNKTDEMILDELTRPLNIVAW